MSPQMRFAPGTLKRGSGFSGADGVGDVNQRAEVSCRVINSLIQYAKLLGADLSAIVASSGLSESYLTEPNNWVSEEFEMDFCEHVAEALGEEDVMYKAGLLAPLTSPLGGIELLVRLLGNPRFVYSKVPSYVDYFERLSSFEVQFAGRTSVLITMHRSMVHPKAKHACHYTRGILAAIPTLWKLPPAIVMEKQCAVPIDRAGIIRGKYYRQAPDGAVFQLDSPNQPAAEWRCVGKADRHGMFELGGVVYGADTCVYEVSWSESLPWYRRIIDLVPWKHALNQETITELEDDKRLLQEKYEEAHKLHQAQSDFLVNAAHELKTPITSLKTSSELIAGEISELDDPRLDRLAGILMRSTSRLHELVSDLLYMSEIESAVNGTELESLNICELVIREVSLISHLCESKEQSLEVKIPLYPVMTVLSLEHFKQILHRLLLNAHNFTPRGGSIAIGLLDDRNSVTIAVSDTGPGISDDESEHVFETFYRTKSSMAERKAGNGLGLTIVKRLVELYKGEAWVRSGPSKGSTFYFSLPKATDRNIARNR